jgi:deoxyribonuclease I
VSEHRPRLRASGATKGALWLVVLTLVAIAHSACVSSTSRGRGETPPPSPAPRPLPAPGDDGEAPPPGTPPPEGPVGTPGNHGIRGFDEAKRELARIYAAAGRHTDLYCGCTFLAVPGRAMRVDLSGCGYVPARDASRAERIEWEHAVPASAFGHTFSAWREGDARCVDAHGKKFHGRKCARVASAEFARIEADLHNLFPVVGEVNGLRGDLPMGVLDPPERAHAHAGGVSSFTFGACQSRIDRGVFLPRREARGDLARAYKYMNESYPERALIDDAHRPVFDAWDREDPPDAWERERNQRIEARQGNANGFIGR